jgi:hypothetical protein
MYNVCLIADHIIYLIHMHHQFHILLKKKSIWYFSILMLINWIYTFTYLMYNVTIQLIIIWL